LSARPIYLYIGEEEEVEEVVVEEGFLKQQQ
jgi:hypothetical protein